MRREWGSAGAWRARDIAAAKAFERDLFGPRRPHPSQPIVEDYARDYLPRPTRPATALTGTEFGKRWLSNTAPADWVDREDAIAREHTSGNVAPLLSASPTATSWPRDRPVSCASIRLW